jgi:hypothetical protein
VTTIVICHAAVELVALPSLLVDAFVLAPGVMQVRLPSSYQPRREFFQVRVVAQILPDDLAFALCSTDA